MTRDVRRVSRSAGLFVLLPVCMWAGLVEPQDPDLAAVFEELSRPVVVSTVVGRTFEGQVQLVDPTKLVIGVRDGAGSAEYTFARESVLHLQLPGDSFKDRARELINEGRLSAGLNLIDLLYAQREPFLPFLAAAEAEWFARTISLQREQGQVSRALDRAEVLAGFVDSEEARKIIRDEILLCLFLLENREAARLHAKRWLENRRGTPDSALGWYVMGALIRQDDPDAALFMFLEPVVFAGAEPVPFLDRCYVGAIQSAVELGKIEVARSLHDEMKRRAIPWPKNENFPDLNPVAIETHE